MSMLLNRRRASAILGLGVLGAEIGGLLAGCDVSPLNVKIGVAQPLSGNMAAFGQDLLNGVTLAVEELNQNRIQLNHRAVVFEILSADDQADTATAQTVAKQLTDSGVVAVIGHFNSATSLAAAPVYAERNVPQLCLSTSPQLTALGLPTTFRLVANDMVQARAMAGFATAQLPGRRYAVIDDGSLYGQELARATREKLETIDKTIALRQSLDSQSTTLESLATAIKLAEVDTIITTLSDFQVLALVQLLHQLNYTQVQLLGTDTVRTTAMLAGANLIQSVYASSPILAAFECIGGKAFLSKYDARFKQQPSYAGHYTYDAMHVIAHAIRQTQSVHPKTITQTLHTFDGRAPVTGSMRWDDKGELRYSTVGIYKAHSTHWEPQIRSDT